MTATGADAPVTVTGGIASRRPLSTFVRGRARVVTVTATVTATLADRLGVLTVRVTGR